jgi:protein CpxP
VRWIIFAVVIVARFGITPGLAQTNAAPPVSAPPPPGAQPPTGGPNAAPMNEPANVIDKSGGSSASAVTKVNPGPTAVPAQAAITEEQARGRLERDGYREVSLLSKAEDGSWRGSARRNGASVNVSVDRDGNVSTR